MPTYSKSSQKKLATCHSNLQILFGVVIQFYDCTIICGKRIKSVQNRAFKEGKSNKEFPDSKHNKQPLSEATDAAPYIKGKGISWNKSQCYAFGGFVMGIAALLYNLGVLKHKIRWGGDWDSDKDVNDQELNDLVHFELI